MAATDTAPARTEAEVATSGIAATPPAAAPPEPPTQPAPRVVAAQTVPALVACRAPVERESTSDKKGAPSLFQERLASAPARAPTAVTIQGGSRALVSSAASATSDTAANASSMQNAKAAPAPVAELAFDDTTPSTSDTPERELEKIR